MLRKEAEDEVEIWLNVEWGLSLAFGKQQLHGKPSYAKRFLGMKTYRE